MLHCHFSVTAEEYGLSCHRDLVFDSSLSLLNCVISNRLFMQFELPFLHIRNRDDSIHLHSIMRVTLRQLYEASASGLARGNHSLNGRSQSFHYQQLILSERKTAPSSMNSLNSFTLK